MIHSGGATDVSSSEAWRPRFHYTAERNWLNDPNGLVWFDGEYHLFYQYNPFGDQWGHMSWGHAVSTDLLHWHELPVAIAEDERASIFSGSVVVDAHNRSGLGDGKAAVLVAAYTACQRRAEGGQAQALAFSRDRGRTWAQYAGNPVLDLGLRDFRDPKVFWHAGTSRWIMATVLPDERCVAFFASADLKAWAELSRFSEDHAGLGIWECPDVIELPVDAGAGRGMGSSAWMLKVDVFEGHPSRGSGARLFFGHFDGTRFIAEPSAHCWADHGADFYAALSWAHLPSSPARQVWIAWMNCHRYAKLLPTQPWRGAMSVPRELSLRRDADGLRLLQQPVRELRALRGPRCDAAPLSLARARHDWLPPALDKRALEIEFDLDCGDSDECGIVLRAGAGGCGTRVGLDRRRGTVYIDRGRSGFVPEDLHFALRREAPCASIAAGRVVHLHLLLDCSSVELFVDGGETVITEQILPPADALDAPLYAEGGTAHFSALHAHAIGCA